MKSSGFGLNDKFWILCETYAVRGNMNTFETNASSIAHCAEKVIRNGRLSTGEQDNHLAFGRHRKGTVENTHYIIHRKFMDIRRMIRIHVTWRTFQIAAIRQICDQSHSAPGSNRRWPMIM